MRIFNCCWLMLFSIAVLSHSLLAAEQSRLSAANGLGNTQGFATGSATAYNPALDQVLVVWWGRDPALAGGDNRTIISGRLVDARSGLPIGPARRLDVNAPGINSLTPDVVYNPIEAEYLLVWANESIGAHFELLTQRLDSSSLQPLLAQPRQITEMGGAGDLNHSALVPAAAFNSDRNEYLVAFVGSDSRAGMNDLQRDVFVQRLDGRDGSELGTDDFRISSASSADGSRAVSTASTIDVVYSAINQNYLVVWSADPAQAGLAAGELEVFAQLIEGVNGQPIGTDDARLTVTGPAGNAFFDAEQPTVIAYDSNFLVGYRADVVQDINEIHVIKVGGTSALPFGGQRRMTFTAGGAASWPQLTLEPGTGEVLIAYQSREVLGSAPVFENEVFVQRADFALQPVGTAERWSVLGPDGSDQYGPEIGLAMTDLGTRGGYLVSWSGDDDQDGQIDGELEVFARSSVVDRLLNDGFE